MSDAIRTIPMRGFTAAVAREESPVPQLQAGGVAVGIDGDGDDRRYAIATRHADGTMLTLYLSEGALHRLAAMLADMIDDSDLITVGSAVTLQ